MGRKLVVYMIDGKAYGPRTAEIGNWSGKAIFSPRANISRLLTRSEFSKPGVYCLKSNPKDDLYTERVYVGEAEKIGERLKQHLGNREFTEYIGFISKDELLTKSHIKYLESRLITLANEAKSAEIENSVVPSQPLLPEADIADMEFFLEQIKLILPLMGFNFLIPSVVHTDTTNDRINSSEDNKIVYQIKSSTLQAKMIETSDGYIVLKGSEAKSSFAKSLSISSRKRRQKLIDNGTIQLYDSKYIFTEDAVFTSVQINFREDDKIVYQIKSSTLQAKMIETSDGYIVLKGSEAKSSFAKSLSISSRKRRQKLIDNGTIQLYDSKYIFTEDAVFTSVSSAAMVVLGRESNGHVEWTDQQGRTYKEIQETESSFK